MRMLERSIVGFPETLRDGIAKLVAETDADELIVVSDVYDHALRLRSFKLIADAAGAVSDRQLRQAESRSTSNVPERLEKGVDQGDIGDRRRRQCRSGRAAPYCGAAEISRSYTKLLTLPIAEAVRCAASTRVWGQIHTIGVQCGPEAQITTELDARVIAQDIVESGSIIQGAYLHVLYRLCLHGKIGSPYSTLRDQTCGRTEQRLFATLIVAPSNNLISTCRETFAGHRLELLHHTGRSLAPRLRRG
ncbi:hypothetical protein V1289_003250 [Bradyrhizobium sp. AZCC 2289]